MLEQIIDKQKLSKMIDRSERIYLRKKTDNKSNKMNVFLHFMVMSFLCFYAMF